jgi:hypothetical protein
MFTAELKINGILVGHLYGRNTGKLDKQKYTYEAEYYEIASGKVQNLPPIQHNRKKGLARLVSVCLGRIDT